MPLYEYECASCQKVHEVMQKFSDDPLAVCPDCNGPVSKLMSMSSFALKGSGWYTTDYKRKPTAPAAKSGDASTASSTGSATAAAATGAPAASPAAAASPASAPAASAPSVAK